MWPFKKKKNRYVLVLNSDDTLKLATLMCIPVHSFLINNNGKNGKSFIESNIKIKTYIEALVQSDIEKLMKWLANAISEERYEDAALLYKLIREKNAPEKKYLREI